MSYTSNVPVSGQSLGVSRPIINSNFTTIQTIFDVNHVDFNVSGGGKHKFVQLKNTLNVIPAGTLAGEGAVYTKTVGGVTNLWYTPDASTKEYQLTNTNTADFSTFGAADNGWSFLPGGLIIQYGIVLKAAYGTGLVTFPRPFTTNFWALTFGMARDSSSSAQNVYIDTSHTSDNTKFRYTITSTSGDYFTWMAIGT